MKLRKVKMFISNAAASRVPFLDLVTPHIELEDELIDVFRHALHCGGFVGGHVVEEFEKAFAAFCGVSHSIAVSSGTDALRFAILATGVLPGDVVLTVPNTFIATAEAISQARAIPEFIDIDEHTYNMSTEALQRFLERECTQGTSGQVISARNGRPVTAIIPVHLFGQMADMDAILNIASKYGLRVIEDSCQAHGAEYFSKRHNRWMKAGSMGDAAAFSFYPGKNLGACGEGGAVTTNDLNVVETIRMLRDHGQVKKYYHDVEGYNGRLDAIQAGVLSVKLAHLATWNGQRRDLADEYNRLLSSEGAVSLPYEPTWSRAVYHLYVIRTADRAGMASHLKEAGVGTGIHYPIPLHLQKAYVSLKYKLGDYPVAESVAGEIISLPMFPQLTVDQQAKVAEEISRFISMTLPSAERTEKRAVARTENYV
jgi:dTDP-4-amino-4,6-dideoxygalactose transaminase